MSDDNGRLMLPPDVVYHQVLASREYGGAARIAVPMAVRLRERGKATRLWVPGAGPAWAEIERMGLSASPCDLEGAMSRSCLRSALANWRVGWALRRSGSGLAHFHFFGHYGALQRGVRWSGVNTVVHVHLQVTESDVRWAFKQPPDLVLTCSRILADQVRSMMPREALARTRVEGLPNPVDVERFTPGDRTEARRRVGALPGVPLLLMLANLAPHKGQETAIRAVAALRRRGIETACWLAGRERGGATEYTRKLEALMRELGVADCVRLLGERNDAPDLLRAADVFLLPSTNEGLPLSILEAQSCRTAVVAAPTAGIPEVVADNETGFLVPAGDADGYASIVARLLTEPDLSFRIVNRARENVTRHFTWPVYFERLLHLYEEVLQNGRRQA